MVIANACPNNNQSFERKMSYTYIYIMYNIFGLTESIFRIAISLVIFTSTYYLLGRLESLSDRTSSTSRLTLGVISRSLEKLK